MSIKVNLGKIVPKKGVDYFDGKDGTDGFSPDATVTQTDSGATIAITDKNGTTTATINNGKDGTNGANGANGEDGFSPTATVTQTETGATITITDKNGTTTAEVFNGKDGEGGVSEPIEGTLIFKGSYNQFTTYKENDVVFSDGYLFRCNTDGTKGKYPSTGSVGNPGSDGWFMMAGKNYMTNNIMTTTRSISGTEANYQLAMYGTTTNPRQMYALDSTVAPTINSKTGIIAAKGMLINGVDVATTEYVDNAMPKIVALTQAEYDALETKDENTYYFIKGE